MREESLATWDGGNITWGGRVGALGTVPVCVRAQEKLGKGFSPSGDFEKFTYLVPGFDFCLLMVLALIF
nr:hypothetical protein [Tanacetum cinerariifolium]